MNTESTLCVTNSSRTFPVDPKSWLDSIRTVCDTTIPRVDDRWNTRKRYTLLKKKKNHNQN